MTRTNVMNIDYRALIKQKQVEFAKLNIAESPAVVRQKVEEINRLFWEHLTVDKLHNSEWSNEPSREVQALLEEAFAGDMVHIEPFQKLKDWVAKWVV